MINYGIKNYKFFKIFLKINKHKFVLLLINVIIFINNFIFLNNIYKKSDHIKNIIVKSFRNSDHLIMLFETKLFIDISNYINKINIKRKKKSIFFYTVDLFPGQNITNYLLNKLSDYFIFKFDENNPDYLIYNVFGKKHLEVKYKNCIKIAYYTENKIPDLNEADYAIGFSHINYLDRFFVNERGNSIIIQKIRDKVINNLIRKKFCAAVISNRYSSDGFRLKFIDELGKYKRVDMGGGFNNNIGGRVKDKIKFFSSYKFSIAMENSQGDGYTSEKIFHSYFSGTIPLYYGNYMINEIFDPKSYILILGEKDMIKKVEYIKQIDNNDKLYISILKGYKFVDRKRNVELKDFFYNIFAQEKSYAFRGMI